MKARLLLGALALALLLVPSVAFADGPQAKLALQGLDGQARSIEAEAGHIVVVNFWATWCRPCLEELPLLEQVSQEYSERGVVFIAASTDAASTLGRIPAAIAKAGVTFDVWTGATTVDMKRFGLGTGVPATAIVDRNGDVAFRVVGLVDEAELRERLDWLLGQRDAAAPAVALDRLQEEDCCDHDEDSADQDSPDQDHPETADAAVAEEHCDHDGDEHAHEHAHEEGPHAVDASLVPS